MTKTLLVITGATASGKTDVAVSVAELLGTEIISADSRQIYREMSIGTAVPSVEQLSKVKHHFIQNKSIQEYYSAGRFEIEALEKINDLFLEHDFVVLTGGTGLYINAVCNGIDELPDADLELREKLHKRFENEGIESLRFELMKLDPEYCKIADLQNPKRILKALEILYQTGKNYSELRKGNSKKRDFKIIRFMLNLERDFLYQKIDRRCDLMLNSGLLEEVSGLLPFRHLNALNTVGYKEFFDFLDNRYSFEEAVRLFKRNTRHYAKRQLTWFRKEKELIEILNTNSDETVQKILSYCEKF